MILSRPARLFVPLAACLVCFALSPRAGWSQETPSREELQAQFTELVQQGQDQLSQGDFGGALQSLSQAAQMSQNNPQTLLLRARAWMGIGELEAALADLNEAISGGQLGDLPGFLGQARNMRADVYLQLGDVATALRDAEAAVKEDRLNPEFHRNLGKAKFLYGDSVAGEKSLSRYINAAESAEAPAPPELAEAYQLRAQAYASMGKFPKATNDINRSLELDPEEHESYLTKGMIFLQQEDYGQASDALQLAIENYEPADPDLPQPYSQAYLTRASALEELGKKSDDPGEAEAAYLASKQTCEELLEELGDEPATAVTRAATLFRLGVAERLLDDLPMAVKHLSDAIDLNPGLGEAYFRRGICFYYLGEPRLALGDFKQGAAINFESPRSNLWKGRCWAALGQPREAIKSFSEAVAVSDRYIVAYVHRGLTYLQIGEFRRAVSDFNNAIRLAPTVAEHYYYRGLAYSELEETEQAIGSLARAIKFDNELLEAYDVMIDQLLKSGQNALADQYRQRAAELRAKRSTAAR